MPENEQDQTDAVEAPDTVPGSPDWGGVPRDGGDNADATGGLDLEPAAAEDLTDADSGEEAEAQSGEAEDAPEQAQEGEGSPTDAGDAEG